MFDTAAGGDLILTDDFLVSDDTAGPQGGIQLAALSDGGFIAVWRDDAHGVQPAVLRGLRTSSLSLAAGSPSRGTSITVDPAKFACRFSLRTVEKSAVKSSRPDPFRATRRDRVLPRSPGAALSSLGTVPTPSPGEDPTIPRYTRKSSTAPAPRSAAFSRSIHTLPETKARGRCRHCPTADLSSPGLTFQCRPQIQLTTEFGFNSLIPPGSSWQRGPRR